MKKFDYESKIYLDKLNALGDHYYEKYVRAIKKYSRKNGKILEVGCGNGVVLEKLKKNGYKNLSGVDVSSLFIKTAKKKGLKSVFVYDGTNLPFKDSTFDTISSFNVLEHTQEPTEYLKGQIKKLKKGGVIIVVCPNFFTPILKTNHRRINGLKNRLLNTWRILEKIIYLGKNEFEMIPPVVRKDFQYDDDSIVVTNPIDLRRILIDNKCKIIYESGFVSQDSQLSNLIDKVEVLRFMMPSCFVVAKKN